MRGQYGRQEEFRQTGDAIRCEAAERGWLNSPATETWESPRTDPFDVLGPWQHTFTASYSASQADSVPTVLVVDDEPNVVQSVSDLLRMHFRVLGASRASDGLRILAHENADIVMSDQRMPEMTGVEFLRQVREMYPDAIRLLFTGYADIKAVIDAINHGHVYRYIAKPWDPDELHGILRQAVALYRLQVERQWLVLQLQDYTTDAPADEPGAGQGL